MLHPLLATLTKKDDLQTLSIGTKVGPFPRLVHISAEVAIRVEARQNDGRLAAEIPISVPFLTGTYRAVFEGGDLRRFAAEIENLQKGQAGIAQLHVIPGRLSIHIFLDEKRQLTSAVKCRRTALPVDSIFAFPIDPAAVPAILEGLRSADPTE